MNEQVPSDSMSLNIDNVLRTSARLRPQLDSLTFLERLELCGIWALAECIKQGCSDESIADMFDTMKGRMLAQAPTIRMAQLIAEARTVQ